MEALRACDRILDVLVERGKLTEKMRERVSQVQRETRRPVIEILADEKLVDEAEITYLMSEFLEIPFLRLDAYQIDQDTFKLIPHEVAERHEVVPVAKIGTLLTVACARPLDLLALDDLKELTGCEIRTVLAPRSEIQNALTMQIAGVSGIHQVLKEVNPGQIELLGSEEGAAEASGVDDAPVVRMVGYIIDEAVRQRASDIHLEPYRDHFRIRYRIDGVLKEILSHSLDIYSALIARIKILSNLDITEKRVPQDGRFKTEVMGKEIDFRVSILPTFFGQKGVLRLLDKRNVRSGLDELGFSKKPIEVFREAIRRPYGMILVTGPTGSGKSTTLYSVLNLLNSPDRNLMTIEDPIEYQIEGITQTQVNPEIGLTFANGLRSLLRQSPDVVLVGEIRDGETADIAVKAALTGHLVLSTLHTNSAAGAVTRLIDMGVEPFLIASSMVLVAGQRLLRRICSYCKTSAPLPPEVLKRIHRNAPSLQVGEEISFRGKGCRHCGDTGYSGRLGAIEVLPLDTEIREAILSRRSSEEIEKIARRKGMETLFENALRLFKDGKTALEEVLRVSEAE